MSADVARVNVDSDAMGTSRLANMSRRPAVSMAAIAPAVVGNTAKSITISTDDGLATHVVIPNTTPIETKPVRRSATIQRDVNTPVGMLDAAAARR